MAKKKVARRPAVKTTPVAASQTAQHSYANIVTYRFLQPLIAILAAMTWLGFASYENNRASSWFMIMILMAAFSVVVGRAITGYWRES